MFDHAHVNPWYAVYRMVMKRLQRSLQVTCPRHLKEFLATLFPHYKSCRREMVGQLNECALPPLTGEELLEICGTIGAVERKSGPWVKLCRIRGLGENYTSLSRKVCGPASYPFFSFKFLSGPLRKIRAQGKFPPFHLPSRQKNAE